MRFCLHNYSRSGQNTPLEPCNFAIQFLLPTRPSSPGIYRNLAQAYAEFGYGNFDITFDRFSYILQPRPTPHAPCATLYFVAMLIPVARERHVIRVPLNRCL